MASFEIARLGNPILRKVATPVDLDELIRPDSEIGHFIDGMVTTMKELGGVGLAAPQVSRSVQIVVLESKDNSRYPDRDDFSLLVLVNPKIIQHTREQVGGWESCLSLNDFSGWVPRYNEVTVEAWDRQGKLVRLEAKGFMAVVLQHEIDHLNGLLFIDRMPDLKKLTYQEEFSTFWAQDPDKAVRV